MQRKKVAVIGAAGHVGLGLTLSIAEAGHYVYGIDINQDAVNRIAAGTVPFQEDGAAEVLDRVLHNQRLEMTTDLTAAGQADVIIIILGTPIDENLNPVLAPLLELCKRLTPFLKSGKLLILRSTLSPGSTETVGKMIERDTSLVIGEDFFLVFAPERVVQGKSLVETKTLPQIIGAFDDRSYEVAEGFFRTFIQNKCLRLTPVEAELAKLMCNMARYVSFALANEFFLIADEYSANIHRILDACAFDYPRFKLPGPGANVSGPCLFKDGFFLVERFPFADLISTSFKINENMPVQILKKIRKRPGIHKVAILGLTFKSGSDDTRYSLSYKLKKLLIAGGYAVECVDPMVQGYSDLSVLKGCDSLVLMTPHESFRDLEALIQHTANENCLFIDIWGFWSEMRGRSEKVEFLAKEAVEAKEVKGQLI